MIVVDGITWRDNNVGRNLSPFLADRLRRFMADPRVDGKVWVVSGSRTFAQQLWLWTKWRAGVGGYNLAANPYRTIGTCHWAAPSFVAKGSWHMVQTSLNAKYAGAGAVDFGWAFITSIQLHIVAAEYGLRFPEPTENWHCQAYTTRRVFDEYHPAPPPTPGAIVSVFGNASFTPIESVCDDEYLVLWHDIDGATKHNFHILNRATNISAAHAVGNAADTFAGATRNGSRFSFTIRRGGNGYHTVVVEGP